MQQHLWNKKRLVWKQLVTWVKNIYQLEPIIHRQISILPVIIKLSPRQSILSEPNTLIVWFWTNVFGPHPPSSTSVWKNKQKAYVLKRRNKMNVCHFYMKLWYITYVNLFWISPSQLMVCWWKGHTRQNCLKLRFIIINLYLNQFQH